MAHVLRVTDGVTTINLADGTNILGEYIPRPGEDGQELEETLKVAFASSSMTTNLTVLRTLNELFQQARRYKQYRVGLKVYVEFDPGTTGTVKRSRLTDGRILSNQDTLDAPFANNQIDVSISWKRMAGWEWPEVPISLSNTSGSGLGGITVTNHNNGAYENWVKITGTDITGDMPARMRLKIDHSYAVNPFMNRFFINHKVDNVTYSHILEGEAATGGTNTADGTASGGSKKSHTWAVTTKNKLCYWSLPSALLDATDHGRFQMILRIDPVAYTDLYLQFKLINQTGSTLVAESALTPVPANQCLFISDILTLPPSQVGGSNAPLFLDLWAQRLSAGTHNLAVDFLQLSAIADESWRQYTCIDSTSGLKYLEALVDDGIEETLYRINTSSLRIPDFSSKGGPLLLQPGRDQRLYFLSYENGGAWRALQTYVIRAYYRPRTRML